MRLEKAIEIKGRKGEELLNTSPAEIYEADRLCIEAGKLIKQHPTIRFFLQDKLLPGETEE